MGGGIDHGLTQAVALSLQRCQHHFWHLRPDAGDSFLQPQLDFAEQRSLVCWDLKDLEGNLNNLEQYFDLVWFRIETTWWSLTIKQPDKVLRWLGDSKIGHKDSRSQSSERWMQDCRTGTRGLVFSPRTFCSERLVWTWIDRSTSKRAMDRTATKDLLGMEQKTGIYPDRWETVQAPQGMCFLCDLFGQKLWAVCDSFAPTIDTANRRSASHCTPLLHSAVSVHFTHLHPHSRQFPCSRNSICNRINRLIICLQRGNHSCTTQVIQRVAATPDPWTRSDRNLCVLRALSLGDRWFKLLWFILKSIESDQQRHVLSFPV